MAGEALPHLAGSKTSPLPPPTPFPDGYVSALVRAAREMGLTDADIPDIGKRGREQVRCVASCCGTLRGVCAVSFSGPDSTNVGSYTFLLLPNRNCAQQHDDQCPPYIGGLLTELDREKRPTLDSLAKYTISLITVSYRTPKSLTNAVGRWASSGLLDFVDEKVRLHECVTRWTRRVVTLHYAVRIRCSLASLASLWQVMFLNAAVDEEKALGAAHGFKVLTAEPETLDWLVPRHHDEIYADAGNEWKEPFPYVQIGEDGRPALWIAPSLLLALHETASTICVFLEKASVATVTQVDHTQVVLPPCGTLNRTVAQ